MSNLFIKKLINSLNVPLKKDNIKNRSMHKSVNKAINMQLIREINNSSKMQTRGMACVHSGRLKPKAPKPKVTDTDVSNSHNIVTRTTCAEKNCKNVNCADPTDVNAECPSRSAQQNQTSIPPTSQGFITRIVGNFTGKIPNGKNGFTVDPYKNYSGQNKAQGMVTESSPATVDSSDINVNIQSTNFAQNHHKIIDTNT